MGGVGPYLGKRINYLVKEKGIRYFIITGTDLSGKNTFADELADVIEETTGLRCDVYDFMNNPFGSLTRFSLDRNIDSPMVSFTQKLGMFGAELWKRVFDYTHAKLTADVTIQVRGGPGDMANMELDSINSFKGYVLLNITSKLTKGACKITLVGDGETLFKRAMEDPERRKKALQRYETPEEIDRVSGNIMVIHDLLDKLGYIGLPEIIYDTTAKEGKSAIVSEKVGEIKRIRKREMWAIRGAIEALSRRGKKIPVDLEEIVEKCEAEEIIDDISEHIDESIKEKNNQP
jgi:tRNA uridine 5-carbamoylmethylation protein Kti12